jgi:hypothetical protein
MECLHAGLRTRPSAPLGRGAGLRAAVRRLREQGEHRGLAPARPRGRSPGIRLRPGTGVRWRRAMGAARPLRQSATPENSKDIQHANWAIRPSSGRNVVVVGTQWGDEGKGKVVDWLTDHAQGVVRFQGGHNAGHTLVIGGARPRCSSSRRVSCAKAWPATSATAWSSTRASAGEIERLEAMGLDVRSRLFISEACPLILPMHVAGPGSARRREGSAGGKIGTTGKGIGPGLRGQGRTARAAHAGPQAPATIRQQAGGTGRPSQRRADGPCWVPRRCRCSPCWMRQHGCSRGCGR